MPKFRADLSVRSKNIAEKQAPANLKPIVTSYVILVITCIAWHETDEDVYITQG